MPITVSLPSRNVELEFPDSMTEQEIAAAIEQEYPRSGEDVAYEVEQAKTATIEGRDLVNPFEGMSNDDYALFRKHLAEKKTSLGDALGIAADTFGTIVSEVGKSAVATGEAVLGGEFGAAGESAVEGMVAGTVGLADIADKIFEPARTIPSKEEFLKRKIETGKPAGMVRGDFGVEEVAIPSFRPATEADYAALIEQEKQRDAEATNRLYAMEATLRGAPIEEIARGFQYVDPTLLASLGGTAAAKLAGKTLFKGAARTAATQAATTVRTAPGAIGQAALAGVERAAGGVEAVAGLPSRAITAVGNIAENIAPGTGLPTRGAAVATTMMGGAGIPLAGAAATEKVAEVVGSVARAARQEASRAGLLERAAMDAGISPAARKVAAGLAQIQPGISAAGRLTAQAAKEGAAGAVVGSGLGYLAEGNLEGAAAGAGAGAAIGGLSGTLRSSFDLGREMLGKSTSRTREQATGDLNRFLGERPEVEQAAWGETINRLVQQVGPERAASQVDAMRIAEANGARVRVATPDEMKQWQNPGWLNVDGMEVVLNPSRILGDTASHETAHVLFSSVINRAFRPEIETAIFGLADPVTGEIVRPGLFDDADLAKVADQIGDSYGTNTQAANEFRGYANVLRNSTDSASLQNARTRIADEMTAAYTGRLFNRIRPGRFNPDRLPLAYRKALNALEDSILDKFRSVLFEKGMDLGFNNVTKTFTNEKGKPIRIPELDAIVKRSMAKKGTKEAAAPTSKPDLIPAKPADRVIWARSYGGARGILNDDGTPKSEAQVNAEAAARWQDMTQRMAALPENERIGIEFSRDKTGKTVMTAKGQISPTAINAILDSGALDPSAKAVLRDVLVAMQDPNKSTFDTRYYGVYTRGRGGNRMVAGVKSASQNEILPYSVEMNSKDGVIIRAVDMTKVRERLETAMNKPQFKSLYGSPADALKDFNRYLENITQVNPVESAMLLGGGEKGAKKRNLFYDALGFRLRNGESLVNAPESAIGKSQNTIKSYRVERFAKLQDSGNRFAFEEATTYERAMRNFQPDAFTRETLPNGEAMTNPDGYRILKKTGSSLFRVYDREGKLLGVEPSEVKAMSKAQSDFAKKEQKTRSTIMRFQYVGESAEMSPFMRDSLDTAKSMASKGMLSETIRAITGWFPGKFDDKMRWEIPDNEVTARLAEYRALRNNGEDARTIVSSFVSNLQEQRFSDATERVKGVDAKSLLAESKRIETLTDQENIRLRDFYAGEENPNRVNNRVPLFYLLDHPKLFEAYPDAAWIPVGFSAADVDPFVDAQFNPSSNVIGINPLMATDDSIVSTALHEVQHWIQKKEGFAKGSNYDAESPYNFDDLKKEEEKYASALRKLIQEHKAKGGSVKTALNSEYGKVLGESLTLIQDAIKKSKEGYKRSAGEIEARDVQSRRKLTPEQRREIVPFSSEKYTKEDAIVRFQPDPVSPEQDAAYLNAVKAGDTAAAQRMVDDAYRAYERANSKWFDVTDPTLGARYRGIEGYGAWMTRDGRLIPVENHTQTAKDFFQVKKSDYATQDAFQQGWLVLRAIKAGDYIWDVPTLAVEGGKNLSNTQRRNITDWAREHGYEINWDLRQERQLKAIPAIIYGKNKEIVPPSIRFPLPETSDIRFQPDSASPNIQVGSNGTRIIKSPSGKFRVYSVTGTLLGIRDSEQAAQKLATK